MDQLMRVQVEVQADNLKTTPRSLYWDERRIGIVELIDQWYGPDYRYSKAMMAACTSCASMKFVTNGR
jgi:hypothetical protein